MSGTANSGRKKLKDEIALIKYYESMLPKVFALVRQKLDSKNEEDQLWAAEWIKTGLVKMIPQVNKIGGDENNPTPIPIYSAKSVKG